MCPFIATVGHFGHKPLGVGALLYPTGWIAPGRGSNTAEDLWGAWTCGISPSPPSTFHPSSWKYVAIFLSCRLLLWMQHSLKRKRTVCQHGPKCQECDPLEQCDHGKDRHSCRDCGGVPLPSPLPHWPDRHYHFHQTSDCHHCPHHAIGRRAR